MFLFFSIRGSLFLGILFWLFTIFCTLCAFARFGWWAMLIILCCLIIPWINDAHRKKAEKREREKAYEEIRKNPYKDVKVTVIK